MKLKKWKISGWFYKRAGKMLLFKFVGVNCLKVFVVIRMCEEVLKVAILSIFRLFGGKLCMESYWFKVYFYNQNKLNKILIYLEKLQTNVCLLCN